MQTRQNPITRGLSKIENLLQRMIEGPFDRSSKVEPAEIARKLELAMEEGQRTLDGGRHLVPNVYDIYVSMKDHQEMIPAQQTLIGEWKRSLINFARQQRLDLRTDPLLRLHGDSQLRPGRVRIDAHIEDPKQASPGNGVSRRHYGNNPTDAGTIGATESEPGRLAAAGRSARHRSSRLPLSSGRRRLISGSDPTRTVHTRSLADHPAAAGRARKIPDQESDDQHWSPAL